MTRNQMEMLSVKSAIERTVNGLVAYSMASRQVHALEFFFSLSLCMNNLVISRQIDGEYWVRPTVNGVDVHFATHGHRACITFLLPELLCLSDEELKNCLNATAPPRATPTMQEVKAQRPLDVESELTQVAVKTIQETGSADVLAYDNAMTVIG